MGWRNGPCHWWFVFRRRRWMLFGECGKRSQVSNAKVIEYLNRCLNILIYIYIWIYICVCSYSKKFKKDGSKSSLAAQQSESDSSSSSISFDEGGDPQTSQNSIKRKRKGEKVSRVVLILHWNIPHNYTFPLSVKAIPNMYYACFRKKVPNFR